MEVIIVVGLIVCLLIYFATLVGKSDVEQKGKDYRSLTKLK